MGDNWILGNLQNALNTWDAYLQEIWTLLTQSPEEFKGGGIWKAMVTINEVLQSVGTALLVLFFAYGLVKTCTDLRELKKPEHVLRYFIRFALAKGMVTYGLDLMTAIFSIGQGIVSKIMNSGSFGMGEAMTVPEELTSSLEEVSFLESVPLWAITLIGGIFMTILSYVLILTVYGRFFKLYFYTALAPVPLASFAGEPTQNVAVSFLKSYCAVILEGAVIVLGCIIYSLFVTSVPAISSEMAPATQLWTYITEIVFNMLVLVGTVKTADHVVKEMMGI